MQNAVIPFYSKHNVFLRPDRIHSGKIIGKLHDNKNPSEHSRIAIYKVYTTYYTVASHPQLRAVAVTHITCYFLYSDKK